MKKILIVILLFVITASAVSCKTVQNIFGKGQGVESSEGIIKEGDPVKIILYYPDKTLSYLMPEERTALFKKSIEETVLSELLMGSKSGSPLGFPKETKILSLSRKDDTIFVNFSEGFIKNFSGNENTATMTIYSIVNSLTEIPGVKNLELRVKGEVVQAYGGGLKLSNPLLRNRDLILRDRKLGPREVLGKQLDFERNGKWLEAYLLYSDEETNIYKKYFHDYIVEMEEVRALGFTNQDYEIGEYTLDSSGIKARVKVNFYTQTSYGTKEKGPDIYFNCVKIDGVWMVDWLTAQ